MFRSNNSVYLKLATLWFVLKAFERGASGVFRKASTVLPESLESSVKTSNITLQDI
jgi:hypothetical protein